MLENLLPAAEVTRLDLKGKEKCTDKKWQKKYTDRVAKKNVELTINNILMYSKDLRDLYNNGDIMIEGAMYDVSSGKVDFFRKND